jgi:hypothetical protein
MNPFDRLGSPVDDLLDDADATYDRITDTWNRRD